MKRSTFLKSILGVGALATISYEVSKEFEKIYLLQCFVRGFQYYEGPRLLSKIKNNFGILELCREANNPHDKYALALYFEGNKIGYIPRESNKTLSRLIDAQLIELQAEITNVEPNAATWENVRLAVYVLKEKKPENAATPAYLSALKPPKYKTLSNAAQSCTRVYEVQSKQAQAAKCYQTIIEKSNGDAIFDSIQEIEVQDFEQAIELESWVLTKENIAALPQSNDPEFIQKLEEIFGEHGSLDRNMQSIDEMGQIVQVQHDNLAAHLEETSTSLDAIFGEEQFLTIKVSQIEKLPLKIERIEQVLAEKGEKLMALILG